MAVGKGFPDRHHVAVGEEPIADKYFADRKSETLSVKPSPTVFGPSPTA
jgi:hypothetical protein